MAKLPGKTSHPGHKNAAPKTAKQHHAHKLPGSKQGHKIDEPPMAPDVHSSGSPSTPHSGGPMPGK